MTNAEAKRLKARFPTQGSPPDEWRPQRAQYQFKSFGRAVARVLQLMMVMPACPAVAEALGLRGILKGGLHNDAQRRSPSVASNAGQGPKRRVSIGECETVERDPNDPPPRMPKQPKPLAEVESPGFLWEEHDRAMAIGEWKARQLRSEIQPDDKISGIRLWWQDYVADLEIKSEDPVSEG